MKNLSNKDGFSRKQRADRSKIANELKVMDDQLDSLLHKVSYYSQFIAYHTAANKKDGYYDTFITQSVVMVLISLKRYNYDSAEKEFLDILSNSFLSGKEKEKHIITHLVKWIKLYNACLHVTSHPNYYNYTLSLRTDIMNQIGVNLSEPVSILYAYAEKHYPEMELPELSTIWESSSEKHIHKPQKFFRSAGYKFLNSILLIKKNIPKYEQEVFNSGYNDPAIALLTAFAKNHTTIISAFNERWTEYHHYYLDRILQAKPQKAIADRTFLQLKKSPESSSVYVPKGTVFSASETVKFSSLSDLYIEDVELCKAQTLYKAQKDVDNSSNISGIKISDLQACINAPSNGAVANPFSLYGNSRNKANTVQEEKHDAHVGIIIHTTSLLFEEGRRSVKLQFKTSSVAFDVIEKAVTYIKKKWHISELKARHHLFEEIFCIAVTTADEWKPILKYTIDFDSYDDASYFTISFFLAKDAPPVIGLNESGNEIPAIRILLNPHARIYPYFWLRYIRFQKVKIITEVEGIKNLEVYSDLGRLDTSMPFYPFGSIPKKGSWFVFGNYEMALKKVLELDVNIKWANLPENREGLADYFSMYDNRTTNCSFLFSLEYLKDRKWQKAKDNYSRYLFNTSASGITPYGKLIPYSYLENIQFDEPENLYIPKHKFVFNAFANKGYYKLNLTSPYFAFGHDKYPSLFSDSFMKKLHAKKTKEMPNPPFNPQVEELSVDYYSENDIYFGGDFNAGQSDIQYIHPFNIDVYTPVADTRDFTLCPRLECEGCVLFGFSGVKGGETIHLLLVLLPSLVECKETELPETSWYYGNGYDWKLLPKDNIMNDGTRNIIESGIIEIVLPQSIPDADSSIDNLFWLKLNVDKYAYNISSIKGLYINGIKAERILEDDSAIVPVPPMQIAKSDTKIPGLAEVIQPSVSYGERDIETKEKMRVRLAERISHKNRAVTERDFEQLILENFPKVKKVKCLSAVDSKQNRRGIVTIVVIPHTAENIRTPLSSSNLLLNIESFLGSYVSMFTTVDAINPVYEFLQVRCDIELKKQYHSGMFLHQLNEDICNFINNQGSEDDTPVFYTSISLFTLINFIQSKKSVARIKKFSVLHKKENGNVLYELVERVSEKSDDQQAFEHNLSVLVNGVETPIKELKAIAPSYPWAILVAENTHILSSGKESMHPGIEEIQVGSSFKIE